jgi:hypothetical protein
MTTREQPNVSEAEMAESKVTLHLESWSSGAFYFAALALLMFSNGRFPIAACSWLAPLFMLHFTRTLAGGSSGCFSRFRG